MRHTCRASVSVQVRLLNRNVGLHIGGVDKYGTLYGTVEHPAGDISVELLKNGYARMVDWSLCESPECSAVSSLDAPCNDSAWRPRPLCHHAHACPAALRYHTACWKDYTPCPALPPRTVCCKVHRTLGHRRCCVCGVACVSRGCDSVRADGAGQGDACRGEDREGHEAARVEGLRRVHVRRRARVHGQGVVCAASATASVVAVACCCRLLLLLVLRSVCCAVLCCAVLCCAVLCCAVLCCAVLCCAVLYCTVLYCTVPYRTVLYCHATGALLCSARWCRCSRLSPATPSSSASPAVLASRSAVCLSRQSGRRDWATLAPAPPTRPSPGRCGVVGSCVLSVSLVPLCGPLPVRVESSTHICI
jgi:hypothetical protein